MGAATEQLKKEHDAIGTMLRILEVVVKKIQDGQKVDREHLGEIVDFFRGFADRCHHGKEEEIFFPALEKAGIPKEGGPIGVMLQEHDQMRAFMKGLAGAVERFRGGEDGAASEIVRHAKDYAAMLRGHIDKENQVLFKMAEMHLSPEEEKELAERFEAMETEKIGAGTHERLHGVLERLEGIYL
ncbi:MAG TPA: hemerythrin domain-containing protein [Nitrospiria bacterium]